MTDKVSLIREHTISTEIPVYTATATFTSGIERPYTYHEKKVTENAIILYDYDLENTSTLPTDFITHRIEEDGEKYSEKIPFPPTIKSSNRIEQTIISLETCEDFVIESEETQTLIYENWGAEVDMQRDAALAYQNHFGEDKIRIR